MSLGPTSNNNNTTVINSKTCGAKRYLAVSKECACCNVLGFSLTSLRHHNEAVAWDRQIK